LMVLGGTFITDTWPGGIPSNTTEPDGSLFQFTPK
jgi:hypothetical protein